MAYTGNGRRQLAWEASCRRNGRDAQWTKSLWCPLLTRPQHPLHELSPITVTCARIDKIFNRPRIIHYRCFKGVLNVGKEKQVNTENMELSLEAVERKFRETIKQNPKYVQRLTEYIDHLASKGKIIEAKYYFHLLYLIKPGHPRAVKLGYDLSIATFDSEGVRRFDKLLFDSKPRDEEIAFFRLKYYISVNNVQNVEECCLFVLSKCIKSEYLQIVVEACVNFKSYSIARSLIEYFDKNRLILSRPFEARIRRILLQHFLNLITEHKCG